MSFASYAIIWILQMVLDQYFLRAENFLGWGRTLIAHVEISTKIHVYMAHIYTPLSSENGT